jgi:hypothetical protein
MIPIALSKQPEPFLVLGTISENEPFILTGQSLSDHKLICGLTGSGKSSGIASLPFQLTLQDIPFYLIDTQGDTAELVLSLFAASDFYSDPQERGYKKVWYIDFSRAKKDYAIPYNILNLPGLTSHEIAQAFLTACRRAFPVVGSTVGMDSLLQASTQALSSAKCPATYLSTFLLNTSVRQKILSATSDRFVNEYFTTIFAEKMKAHYFDSSIDALQRRSFLLSFPPELRHIFGQRDNVLDFGYLIEHKISCIFNLSNLAEDTQRLLACILLVHIEMALNQRARIHPSLRHPVHILVEEFGSLLDQSEVSFQNFLNGMRKWGASLMLLTQATGALTPGVRVALQNAQTTILFKLGYDDSKWAVDRFLRPLPVHEKSLEELEESVKEVLFGDGESLFGDTKAEVPDAFAACATDKDARLLLESQQPGQAIIIRDGRATSITTNIIPSLPDNSAELINIKNNYCQRLCTKLPLNSSTASPAPQIALVASDATLVQPPTVQKPQRAKRRVP